MPEDERRKHSGECIGLWALRKLTADDEPKDTVSAWKTEALRLRKVFDDAGCGEHNVLALIDHYQRSTIAAEERISAAREILGEYGCDCYCDCAPSSHGTDCDPCWV
jgi:hypothetical protein